MRNIPCFYLQLEDVKDWIQDASFEDIEYTLYHAILSDATASIEVATTMSTPRWATYSGIPLTTIKSKDAGSTSDFTTETGTPGVLVDEPEEMDVIHFETPITPLRPQTPKIVFIITRLTDF